MCFRLKANERVTFMKKQEKVFVIYNLKTKQPEM